MEEELEIKEDGVQGQLYQNIKENQKQLKKQTSCTLAKSAGNQNTRKKEKEQENSFRSKMASKIKMILCDKDGCLVSYPNKPYHSSWDALSLALPPNKREEWFKIRDYYIGTDGSYEEWANKQVNLLKMTPLKEIERVLFPVPYSKGVKEFFSNLNGNYIKGIVSSGIDIVAEKIKEELNFDFYLSNHLNRKNGFLTGEITLFVEMDKKAERVKEVAERYNIRLEEICFVGDNFNDVPVMEIVGLPIAYNPKTEDLKKKAMYVISDFRELNHILGQH